jgi:hypothetical protein
MAPILWQRFESNLLTDDPQLFEALVSPKSNILNNVKVFGLLRDLEVDEEFSKAQQQSLITFLTALPRDKLTEFTMAFDLDQTIFRVIVQTQRKLKEVNILLSESLSELSLMDLAPYLADITHAHVFCQFES